MPSFERNGLRTHFEQFGSRADTPLVLIHGLGCQLTEWPPSLIAALTAGGYRVIAPDNRDIGLSVHMTHLDAATPEVIELLADEPQAVRAGLYSLSDMADDVVGLLDYLGQSGAHIVGLSMGGMIAQRIAIEHPERCFSLTCMMTYATAPPMETLDMDAALAFFAEPDSTDVETLARYREAGWNAVAGPHFLSSECGIGRFAAESVKRCYHRKGFARQLHAIRTDADRAPLLNALELPTLVIHGEVDPLVPVSAGEAIADVIPDAEFEPIGHMGHDLPEPLVQTLADHILEHMDSVEVER